MPIRLDGRRKREVHIPLQLELVFAQRILGGRQSERPHVEPIPEHGHIGHGVRVGGGVEPVVAPRVHVGTEGVFEVLVSLEQGDAEHEGWTLLEVSADVVPPGRVRVGQEPGEGVFADDGAVPAFELFRGGFRASSALELVEHRPFNRPVHPTVVEGGGDVTLGGRRPSSGRSHGGPESLSRVREQCGPAPREFSR